MSASVDPLIALAPERRLSGTALFILAFVAGTLFALLPMYYVYTSRDPASRGAPANPPSSAAIETPPRDTPRAGPHNGGARFAARMTYELSHTPAELPVAPLKVTARAEVAAAVPPVATQILASSGSPVRAEVPARVQNARPIIAAPPDPRDTTRGMEKEARQAEYREPQRQIVTQSVIEPAFPRVVEGREFVLPPKTVTRRIAVAEPATESRVGDAAPRESQPRTQVATAPVNAGATIAVPQAPSNAEIQKTKAEASPAAADMLGDRLSATREWLAAAAQTTHTIQLMGSSSEAQMRSQLRSLAKLVDPGKLYVIRTMAQGKPSMTVLYGAYADRQAALQALEKLPAAIAANKPMLRTVNGIRAEQKQHGADS